MPKKSESQSKFSHFEREQFAFETYSYFPHIGNIITPCLFGKELFLKETRFRCPEAIFFNVFFSCSISWSTQTLFQLMWEQWHKLIPVSPGILHIQCSCSKLSKDVCSEGSSFDFLHFIVSAMWHHTASHMSLVCIPVERPGVCWDWVSALFRCW